MQLRSTPTCASSATDQLRDDALRYAADGGEIGAIAVLRPPRDIVDNAVMPPGRFDDRARAFAHLERHISGVVEWVESVTGTVAQKIVGGLH